MGGRHVVIVRARGGQATTNPPTRASANHPPSGARAS
jgi:hypothetical protein